MKVLKPTQNKLTQDYSSSHKGYDHDDKDSKGKVNENYCSSFYGKVVQAKNSETRNWVANTASDPYKPATGKRKLLTEDYGNYIKIKSEIGGKVYYQLAAHFKVGTVLPVGTDVAKGQVIAQIGNTGNSTGSHVHTEYRDSNNECFEVEFIDKEETPPMETQTKEQIIIDSYKATTGEYPTDDEKKFRLQQNKNTLELIEDLLKGDGRSKPRWLKIWGIKEVEDNVANNYETTVSDIREILRVVGIVPGDDTEKVEAKISELVKFYQDHKDDNKPKVTISLEGKDLHYIRFAELVIGILNKEAMEKINGGDKK